MNNLEQNKKTEFDEIDSLEIERISKSVDPNSPEAQKCKKILELDKSIRFAGICSVDGDILAAEYKKGVSPLFNSMELEFSILTSTIRTIEKNMLGTKLGQMFYSITAYENVKRATFTLDDGGFLLVSFERSGNEREIVDKVLYDIGLK